MNTGKGSCSIDSETGGPSGIWAAEAGDGVGPDWVAAAPPGGVGVEEIVV
jgi:hypothetical protein